MSELGTRLQQARTEKGLSIDDVQSITKIQKRYLIGIEEGNYDSMPGPFYIRAFVRQYADAVGLSGEQLLNDYKNELPAAQKSTPTQMNAATVSRRGYRSGGRFMEIFPMILVALFVIAIIAIAYVLSQRAPVDSPVEEAEDSEIVLETQPQEDEPAAPIEEEEETVEEDPVEPEPTVTITPTRTQGENAYIDVTGTEALTVRIEFTGESWLSILRNDLGGELMIPSERVYSVADSPFTFEAPEPGVYRIRLGVTANSKVFINDEPLPFQTGMNSENLYINWTQ